MIDEKKLREKFGRFSLYLIKKAESKIKEIYQQNLFEKANIKKKYSEQLNENSLKMRNHFIETYNQFLNNILSQTLLNAKAKILELKKKLIEKLKDNIREIIIEKINTNYSSYLKYLTNKIKDVLDTIVKHQNLELFLNSKDYNYFFNHLNEIKDLSKKEIEIKNANYEFIGGFKIFYREGLILNDFTIENLINKNSYLIEIEFSKIFSFENITKIEDSLGNFIRDKKDTIQEFLEQYDRV
ncbi:MAG: V-type ATP synthase subunit E family protein [Promethearchaeota archaeon]